MHVLNQYIPNISRITRVHSFKRTWENTFLDSFKEQDSNNKTFQHPKEEWKSPKKNIEEEKVIRSDVKCFPVINSKNFAFLRKKAISGWHPLGKGNCKGYEKKRPKKKNELQQWFQPFLSHGTFSTLARSCDTPLMKNYTKRHSVEEGGNQVPVATWTNVTFRPLDIWTGLGGRQWLRSPIKIWKVLHTTNLHNLMYQHVQE